MKKSAWLQLNGQIIGMVSYILFLFVGEIIKNYGDISAIVVVMFSFVGGFIGISLFFRGIEERNKESYKNYKGIGYPYC